MVDHQRPVPVGPGTGLDTVLYDSVWSDPGAHRGVGSSERGTNVITFGPDITKKFLKNNNLRLVVRSHQVPADGDGHQWWHQNMCVTIFTASNYCGDCGNLGGVLVLARDAEDTILEH